MNRKLTRPLLSLALAGALVGAAVPAVLADGGPPAAQSGDVLVLEHTPNIFVRDAAGAVHLAADPASLAQHQVNWLASKDVSVDELRQFPRGEPWLSMALVKLGDFVYLPEGQASGAPVLRLIKSVDDLALLGVTGDNYGRLVLDRAAWEARYGFDVDGLRYDTFSLDGRPAVAPAWESTQTTIETATA